MLSLHDLQVRFTNYIFNPDEFEVDGYLKKYGLPEKRRLQIYRNNIFIRLTNTLRNVYPTVQRLTGEEFFTALAQQYIKKYPSISSNLFNFGAKFQEYMANFPPLATLPYLSEVAMFEWARHEVLNEQNMGIFDWQALQAVPVEKYEALKFHLNPASRLLNFHFPILQIWKICQEPDIGENINITAANEQVLVIRCRRNVCFEKLSYSEFIFLDGIKNEKSFSLACLEALKLESDFNVNFFLLKHLQRGTIMGFSLE